MQQDRILSFVRECQIFANALSESCSRHDVRRAVTVLAASVPATQSHAESLCIAGIFSGLAQQFGHHVHVDFHRQFGGSWRSCRFDDSAMPAVLRAAEADRSPGGVFVRSVERFLEAFDVAHPLPPAIAAAQLIERHSAEGISIRALARSVGVHPVRLRALFRESYNCTIREYLTRHRLERAAERLEQSKLPVDEIARQAGFGSLDHFYRAFARAYRSTPASYRRERSRVWVDRRDPEQAASENPCKGRRTVATFIPERLRHSTDGASHESHPLGVGTDPIHSAS